MRPTGSKPRLETKTALRLLKAALKGKGYKYRDIAQYIELSIPTVKRMMTDPEISFDRICALCDLVEMSVFDLMQMAKKETHQPFMFSDEQNAFLADNPKCVSYFFALQRENLTPEEIEQKHGISRQSTQKYLKDLEEIGLIDRLAGNTVKLRVPSTKHSRWNDASPLGIVYSKHILSQMRRRILNHLEKGGNGFFDNGHKFLTKQEYDEFRRDWHEFVDKYHQKSMLNTISQNKSASSITYLVAADQWRDSFFNEIVDR